jgi:hypothetical protein
MPGRKMNSASEMKSEYNVAKKGKGKYERIADYVP